MKKLLIKLFCQTQPRANRKTLVVSWEDEKVELGIYTIIYVCSPQKRVNLRSKNNNKNEFIAKIINECYRAFIIIGKTQCFVTVIILFLYMQRKQNLQKIKNKNHVYQKLEKLHHEKLSVKTKLGKQ